MSTHPFYPEGVGGNWFVTGFAISTAVVWSRRSARRAVCGWRCCLLLLIVGGCSQTPARVAVPDYDPAAIARAVLAEFDRNHDGQLSGAEVQSLAMLMRDDANHDGALSGEELQAIVQEWVDDRAGRCELTCRVTAGGQPLAGATITYQPLAALEGLVPTGTATTDQHGVGIIACSVDGGPPKSGMPCGFYRVTIAPAGGASAIDHDQVFEVSSRDTNVHNIALTSSLARAR